EISRQVGIELSNRVLQRRTEGIRTLSGTRTHKDCAKLRGGIGAEQRHEESRAIGLLIERTLHQRVWDDADDGSPRLWVARIENSNPVTDRAFTTIIFSRKTGVYQRDWLFCVGVINGEVAAFQDFQTEGGKIIVRDRFKVAPRPIAVGHILLAVHLKLPLAVEGHAKAATHGGRIKLGIVVQCTHGAVEKFT